MGDYWKPIRWTLKNGDTLMIGHRTNATNQAREELKCADVVPETWKIAQVIRDGERVGFGLNADPELAKLAALFEAGHLDPVPEIVPKEIRAAMLDRQARRLIVRRS